MNDLILSSFVDRFSESFSLDHLDPSKQFEHFVTHCVISRDYQGSIDLDDINTGSAMGIDGIAVFVNDILITNTSELDSVVKHRLDARFVFTQSKTSSSLDLGDLLKFLAAVETFFSKDAGHGVLAPWHVVRQAIYKNAIKFDRNPRLELYFGYTGSYSPNVDVEQQVAASKARLLHKGLFSEVAIAILDAEGLKSIFRTLSNKITRTIAFQRHTSLPKIEGVKRAYIGILASREYLKLITDDTGRLNRKLFYDNVRDYQGENAVNREVIETLVSEPHGKERFVLLNNGVTIVAKSINPVGDDFMIRDFQIVNGCQTSHILFNNEKFLTGSEFVTIKLIETEDSDLTNNITKATNRQTGVTNEAFAALQPFHKELESYYEAVEDTRKLYYERRPGQYDWDVPINRGRIVSVPNQIKSFLSVILEEPHKIHFYYGQLLNEYNRGRSALFIEGHDPAPYFLAAWLTYLVTGKFRRQSQRLSNAWRYHVALGVRILAGGLFDQRRLDEGRFCKDYCDTVYKQIDDQQTFNKLFEEAARKLQSILKSFPERSRDLQQEKVITSQLIAACSPTRAIGRRAKSISPIKAAPSSDGMFVGSISSMAFEQDVGFITYGQLRFYFRPSKGLVGFSTSPPIGTRVRFKIRREQESNEAYDIRLVS